MANSGPNSNLSQFFITYSKQPHLNLKYTVFGKYNSSNSQIFASRVIDGFDALDLIEATPTDPDTNRPFKNVAIQSVKIHANPFADGQMGV